MSEKRFWTTLEDLHNDPKVEQLRGEEFAGKPEEFFNAQSNGGLQVGRREFMKWSAGAMALVSAACSRKRVDHLVPYAQQPEEILPGVEVFYASTCSECAAGCGLLVRTREGRPVKVEGNPLHPVNQGTLCARGQASLMNLYDPDRLRTPMRIGRGQQSAQLDWGTVDKELANVLRTAGKRSVLLTGTIHGPARTQLLSDFTAQFGTRQVTYDYLNADALAGGQQQAYGAAVVPRYYFDRAEMLVTFGADPLGSGISRQEYAVGFGVQRKVRTENGKAATSRTVCFEPAMSMTGVNADTRFLVRPTDLVDVALAIAHHLVVAQKQSSFAGAAGVGAALGNFSTQQVAQRTGVPQTQLEKVANQLWDNRGKSIVLAGGLPGATQDEAALHAAANFLNAVLGNEGATIDGSRSVSQQAQGSLADMLALVQQMQGGQVDVLLIYGTNPAYTLPPAVNFQGALKNVKYVAVIGDHLDETARLADVAIPALHGMESWGDAEPQKGLYSIVQPTILPLFNGRSFEDTLISVARTADPTKFQMPQVTPPPPVFASEAAAPAAGGPPAAAGAGAAPAPKPTLVDMDFHDYLIQVWKTNIYAKNNLAGTFEDFWTSVLRDGVFDPDATRLQPGPARKFNAAALTSLPALKAPRGNTQVPANHLMLALTVSPMMGDGSRNNNGFLFEASDPVSKVVWDNFLSISPATAAKYKLEQGDILEVAVNGATLQAPVWLQPGVHAEVMTLQVGYGRQHVGSVGDGVGVNAYPLAQVNGNTAQYAGFVVPIKKVGSGFRLVSPQGNSYLHGRHIIHDTTLEQFQANPRAGNEEGHEQPLSIWDNADGSHEHPYPGYRWGMTIDLNACIGCNACVVACHAENNVPVVGKNQIERGREMDWIRIDRYYSGPVDNPDVSNQPMLCQQCGHAGCESVCPVLATVHNDEGLNLQVYNRCVGTRFCSNNCIYKVRRFNFYQYSDYYPYSKYTDSFTRFTPHMAYGDTDHNWRESPLELALNPDVTVRSRGVMEKCSFCVQRITAAHYKSQELGVPIPDGGVKTACQQTCPTRAIVFGNMNDPNSAVRRARDTRSYRVLEDYNFQPSIDYLTRVRNRAPRPDELREKPRPEHAEQGENKGIHAQASLAPAQSGLVQLRPMENKA